MPAIIEKKALEHCASGKNGQLTSEKTWPNAIPYAMRLEPSAARTDRAGKPYLADTNQGDKCMETYRQDYSGRARFSPSQRIIAPIVQIMFSNGPLAKEVESNH